ncbi:MAG: ATPase [Planctomycetota bacterium]
MPRINLGQNQANSLALLVESVVFPLLRDHPGQVHLEIDIDLALTTPGDATATGTLLESATRQTLDAIGGDGELSIIAVPTPGGIEIELSDNGPAIASRPEIASLLAARHGVKMQQHDCPQGGVATTLHFPKRQTNSDSRRAA